MDSILVFDDFKHCFRELDTSNYNDDLVVGSVFFTRDAINVIEKYYRIIGYIICDDKGVYYPIDVRKNDIAILEGTYNCIEDELKKELVPYNIKIAPAEVWSPFFFRWQFKCDWNVFETCGDFINIASKIIGNERLMKKIIDDKIDYVLPVNYKELSQMVRGLNKLFGVEFYNKDYYEEVNYLFDSLVNGYHINMSTEEVETYCYQLWIKVNIENDREYNRLETLKSYNYEIISRISSHEIREKLMAKGLYDKAEQKDFSVETGRDYNLEIINLLKEDGYNEKAEGVIITQIEKREIGLHKLIMEAGDIIAPKHMEEYVNRCVVKFILSESKYGYIGSGISDVFERYYEMFNDDTWILLFENIVTRFAESDYGTIASLWGDFTIFSIHYLSRRDKDKIKALFDCLCKTHESLSSANGRVKIKEEKLILDENITSLSDMVNFQLNI